MTTGQVIQEANLQVIDLVCDFEVTWSLLRRLPSRGRQPETAMTSQEMMKAKCKPGYWFVNVAPVDGSPDWHEQVEPHRTDGTLFGYTEKEFLAKQYRVAA